MILGSTQRKSRRVIGCTRTIVTVCGTIGCCACNMSIVCFHGVFILRVRFTMGTICTLCSTLGDEVFCGTHSSLTCLAFRQLRGVGAQFTRSFWVFLGFLMHCQIGGTCQRVLGFFFDQSSARAIHCQHMGLGYFGHYITSLLQGPGARHARVICSIHGLSCSSPCIIKRNGRRFSSVFHLLLLTV